MKSKSTKVDFVSVHHFWFYCRLCRVKKISWNKSCPHFPRGAYDPLYFL